MMRSPGSLGFFVAASILALLPATGALSLDGKVTKPLKNLRYNQSLIELLNNVDAMSEAIRAGGMVVPAIRATGFQFTSTTRF